MSGRQQLIVYYSSLMKSLWSDETGRIINKVNNISCWVPLTSLYLKKICLKKILHYWPSFASGSSSSATQRSADLAFVAFESILHVLPWSDRCLLCLRDSLRPTLLADSLQKVNHSSVKFNLKLECWMINLSVETWMLNVRTPMSHCETPMSHLKQQCWIIKLKCRTVKKVKW